MKVGVQLIFQNAFEGMSDEEMYLSEAKLAEKYESMGYDAVWSVEHHFRDYAMCPDNTQFLTWLAARTQRIKLGTGAVILPWNDPLRVAEKITVLDHLSGGRVIFGMGRGLARREYAGFRMDMNEARARFDEAARMILKALETGWIEGDGPFYKQPRTAIRPRPSRSFQGRAHAVAVSVESVSAVASIGARMMFFTQYSADKHKPGIEEYRKLYREQFKREPAPVTCVGFMYCDRDAGRAEEIARRHIGAYFHELVSHYELMGEHFKDTTGYKGYANAAAALREAGMEAACEAFIEAQDFGTPKQILDRIERRRAILGNVDVSECISFGGLPYADAERSARLFAEAVLPELRGWKVDHDSEAEPAALALA